MHWEGDEDAGDRAKASQFQEKPALLGIGNCQLIFRIMRVEDGEGGSGNFDFEVSQERLR